MAKKIKQFNNDELFIRFPRLPLEKDSPEGYECFCMTLEKVKCKSKATDCVEIGKGKIVRLNGVVLNLTTHEIEYFAPGGMRFRPADIVLVFAVSEEAALTVLEEMFANAGKK